MKIKKLTQYYTLRNSNTQLKIISFQHFFHHSNTPINNSQTKMSTNQIKSIRRTKKLGPTINEHRNEKTYLKLYGKNMHFCWLDVERRILTEGLRAVDERSVSSKVSEHLRCLGVWMCGHQCLKEESVWGWESFNVWVWKWVI